MDRILTLWMVLGLLMGIGGCDRDSERAVPEGSGESAGETKDRSPVIGLSVLTMTNPFFKEIADNMADEAKKHGFEVVTVSGEQDPARQHNQVKEFIVRKVSAIVLTPCDSRAVGAAIKEANAAGIPVFTADIKSLSDDAKVICHIATDNYAGGREAAKAMMRALDNRGKVAILDYPEVESVLLRTKGFRDELAAASSPIQIVGSWPSRGAKDEGFKSMQDILTAHKDLAGVFAINDPAALGAYAAIEKANLAGKIRIIGFDGQPEGRRAIRDGKIYADPVQYPDRIGRQTVEQVMKYLSGEKAPPEVLIPTGLYFQADAQKDPTIQ